MVQIGVHYKRLKENDAESYLEILYEDSEESKLD